MTAKDTRKRRSQTAAGGGSGDANRAKRSKTQASSSPTDRKSRTNNKKAKPVPKSAPSGSKDPSMTVDVERQCGVPLAEGGYCARSLTCKTHSMGAKRAVPGRSQPYDVLLAAYQRRNQLKQAMLNTKQHESAADAALAAEEGVDGVILNEDEEFEQVMAGVLRAYPVPLERKVIMPTQTKSCFFRMREMLIGSLSKVPPLPATLPPSASPDASHSVNAVMLGTGAVLGRTIVFDTLTGAQYARPPRVYVSPAAAAAVATARQQTAMAHATSPQLVQQAVLNQQRVRQVQAQQQHQQLQSAAAGGLRSTPG